MASSTADITQTHPYTCNSCAVAFRNSDAQRTHMRSDWHRYNLKRKVADLPPVSSDDYNDKVLAAQATNKAAAESAAYNQSCTICRKTYYSEHAYENHMNSKAHRLREARGDGSSVNGSTVSKAESRVSETPDPKAQAEFDEVVAGIKKTSLKERPDLQRRPSAPGPEEETRKQDHPMSPEKSEVSVPPLTRCFFCNYDSPNPKLSVEHMTRIHGLFIPEQTYLTDREGLLGYLQAKIHSNHECLWCHKLKNTTDGVQTHMRDKGHCRIAFESEEEMIEVGQFYDFSSTYSDPEADDDSSDVEMDGTASRKPKSNGGVKIPIGKSNEEDDGWETDSSFSSLDSNELTSVPVDDRTESYNRLHLHRHHSSTDPRPHKNADGYHSHAHHHNNAVFYDDYEMHLPSGRVAGHRSLKKYYRQNLHNYPSQAERLARSQRMLENDNDDSDSEMEDVEDSSRANPATPPKSSALTRRGEAGMIGVTDEKRALVRKQEMRERRKMMRAENRYRAGVEKGANSQKHFRVSLNFWSAFVWNGMLTLCIGSATAVVVRKLVKDLRPLRSRRICSMLHTLCERANGLAPESALWFEMPDRDSLLSQRSGCLRSA
jgi:pre-60S factor REI1